jgi:hypothetical protein
MDALLRFSLTQLLSLAIRRGGATVISPTTIVGLACHPRSTVHSPWILLKKLPPLNPADLNVD